jgi:oligopeptide/dipeptide ABC transporter ATP-binding protein
MSDTLLELHDVRTWFPVRRGIFGRVAGHIKAVDGVSLTIAPGETLGLVGESGCGKSTLARTILQLEPPGLPRIRHATAAPDPASPSGPHAGHIVFMGQSLLDLKRGERRAMRRQMQVVFQDPMASLNPRMTVADIVTEGLLAHGVIRRRDRAARAAELLREVGMDGDALQRYPHEFSGGQRQRICVARAIALRPNLVICDEAVSALDVSVQAQVINLLMDLKQRHGLAYLFITHDLGVVRHIAERIAVMYLGRIVEQGPATTVIDTPRHPYTRALVTAIPRVGHRMARRAPLGGDVPSPLAPPPGCPFHPRCPYAIEDCRRIVPHLEPDTPATPHHQLACIRKDDLRSTFTPPLTAS